MAVNRHYDTVAFDVRENAAMLFFAKTGDDGDIDDYLLLMRTIEPDFDESTWIEINERQFGGPGLVREATLMRGVLALSLNEPAALLGGEQELVLSYLDTPGNGASIQQGVFRILGDALAGGNA